MSAKSKAPLNRNANVGLNQASGPSHVGGEAPSNQLQQDELKRAMVGASPSVLERLMLKEGVDEAAASAQAPLGLNRSAHRELVDDLSLNSNGKVWVEPSGAVTLSGEAAGSATARTGEVVRFDGSAVDLKLRSPAAVGLNRPAQGEFQSDGLNIGIRLDPGPAVEAPPALEGVDLKAPAPPRGVVSEKEQIDVGDALPAIASEVALSMNKTQQQLIGEKLRPLMSPEQAAAFDARSEAATLDAAALKPSAPANLSHKEPA